MSHRLSLHTIRTAFLCASILALTLSANSEPRFNLPKFSSSSAYFLSTQEYRLLWDEVAEASAGENPSLSPAVQQVLVKHLTWDGRGLLGRSCEEMVKAWGQNQEPHWTVRVLYLIPEPGQISGLFAFRCGSKDPALAAYFDEHLEFHTIYQSTMGSSSIDSFPYCVDCELPTQYNLTHYNMSQVLSLKEGLLLELAVRTSTDNPCCPRLDKSTRKHLMYLLLKRVSVEDLPGGGIDHVAAPEVVLFIERFAESTGEENSRPTEQACNSEVLYTKNKDGYLKQIEAVTECEKSDIGTSIYSRRFRWNRRTQEFDEIVAEQPFLRLVRHAGASSAPPPSLRPLQ